MTFDYEKGARASTHFDMTDDGRICRLVIGEREGSFKGMTENRTYSAKVHLFRKPQSVKVDGNDTEFTFENNSVDFDIGTGKNVEIVY
ncbi:MAG: DUF5110 domain-containing protein [Eubacteriales bacterium]